MQEEIVPILEKNVTVGMNIQIVEAIEASFKKMRRMEEKCVGKEVYNDLVEYLRKEYGFNIDISEVNKKVFETPEERYVYLLREIERENQGQKRKSITQIAEELGCDRRTLQLDIKRMTEKGFKILGQNIRILDEGRSIYDLDSTPHPVILMQNILQLIVVLEGLRAMEKNRAYYNYARQTAINIWLQLTEYAQDKILTYFEKLEDNEEIIKWYIYLDEGSKYHNRFLTELENAAGNIDSQLLYLFKNQKLFNLVYYDAGERKELFNCKIKRYNPRGRKVIIETPDGNHELSSNSIVGIDSV